jgi:divinyl protochlorophyllide a 8-vinyl-reductase
VHHPQAESRIGPNSLIQTFRALAELESPEVVRSVKARAALPESWPDGMIPEAWFMRLVVALRETLPSERSEAILRRSGRYTAEYVGAHRIPKPIRAMLRVLPARLGIPILLRAFDRHAWTFAGAGRFASHGPFPGEITLDGCPTCRAESTVNLEGHAGAYYEAAFEGLLRLAARDVHVREVDCRADHATACRFRVSIEPQGEPCASS